jgi:hypothetical protein
MRLEVFMVMNEKIMGYDALYFVGWYQHFGEISCLHLNVFYLEHGDSQFP